MTEPFARSTVASALVEQITPLLEQLKASLSDPTVQALRQRDAFEQAWETALHDLLRNMQQIRQDISLIRQKLTMASEAGSADTEKILEAIKLYHHATTDYFDSLDRKNRGWIRRIWEAL